MTQLPTEQFAAARASDRLRGHQAPAAEVVQVTKFGPEALSPHIAAE